MQREVAAFRSKLQMLYKQHLELISSIPVNDDLVNAEFSPKPVADTTPPPTEPVRNPDPLVYDEPEVLEEEPLPEEEPEEDDDTLQYSEQGLEYSEEEEEEPYYEPEPEPEPPKPRRESRFGPLKFGKEFDIKRDDEKRRR